MMSEWILSSSLLIAAVLALRFLLRGRISLRLQYGLWLVVLIRLLLPVQLFTSDFGAGSIAQDVDISAPVRQVYTAARNDNYQIEYDAAYQQVVAEYEARNQTIAPDAANKIAYTRVQQNRELDLNKLLCGIWFAGMVVMTSVIVSCNVHLGLQLKRRRWEFPVTDSLLPVYVTEAVPTPCVFGLFRPAIYLTPEAARDEQIRHHVLTHELTHYRHWDHIWSVLRSVCLVLHWYNPLVWIAARVSRADAELACDEGALAKLGEEHRGDYGRTLIGLTCADHGSSMFITATTMTGSAGSIRERIKLLMKRPRNTVLTLTAVILIGVLIVGCTFAGAPETTQPTESTPLETTSPSEPTGHAPDNDMSYQGQDLPIPEDPADPASEVMALFDDPDVLAGLTSLWGGWEGFSLPGETEPFVPEILDCQDTTQPGDTVARANVYYRRPGSEQLYAAQMLRSGGEWELYGNRLVVTRPPDSRELTEEEIAQVSAAFRPDIYDEERGEGHANPLACIINSYYADVTELDLWGLLYNFPTAEGATQKEFTALREKYGEDFLFSEFENISDMPVPTNRYRVEDIDAALRRYAGISHDDLSGRCSVQYLMYLEETDSYYNFTSDFGLLGFHCTGGWVYDGGALLVSDHSALYLTERDGIYYIQAHLPAIVAEG